MSPLQALAPDQRAVLELLLRQGRSYAELSELLGIPEFAVRSRAHAALAALAPDVRAPIGEDGAVADWMLGQQDASEAERTREALARTPAWRLWAGEVADRLAEVDGAEVPEVPEAKDDQSDTDRAQLAPGRPAAKPAPARTPTRPRPVRDGATPAGARPAREQAPARAGGPSSLPLGSSRLGGALLIGLLALLIGVVLFVFVFRGDEEDPQTASEATATPTATATPQVVNEVILQGVGNKAQGLMRVFRREEDGKLVFALAADNLPPNKSREVYAVWFTRKGGPARNLDFSQTRVGKDGVFTTGGPQQGQETDFARWLVEYDEVVLARPGTNAASAKRPGAVVLRGTLPGGAE